MKSVIRLEEAEVVKYDENEDGFLTVELAATRTGVMPYYDWQSDEIVKELKAPEELFSDLTMNSLKGVPVTSGHPPILVNSANWMDFTKGTTHNDVRQEDNKLVVSETLFDEDLIAYVKSGKKAQASIGFRCDIDETPGEFEGEEYDQVQRNIRINHVAHVKEGRAGEEVRARIDSKDGRFGQINYNEEREDKNMAELVEKLDGLELEEVELGDAKIKVLPEDVEKVEGFLSNFDKVQGKLDSKKGEIKALENRINNLEDVDVEKVVQDRLDLIGKVRKYVADFDPSGLSEKEIKVEMIKKLDEDFDQEGRSDDYIEAMFDGTLKAMSKIKSDSYGANSLQFKRKDNSNSKLSEKKSRRKNLKGGNNDGN